MKTSFLGPPSATPGLWFFASACFAFAWGAAGADWAERLAAPPADARILKIIHNWPDAPAAQDRLISRLGTQAFGGVVCNVSFDQYLESEAKWQAFTRAVKEAKRAGMAMWLYDERGYPSGNTGGLTLRDHPEWEARGLLVADAEATGGAMSLELPPGKLVLAQAFPVGDGVLDSSKRVDLSGQVRNGKIQWQVATGRWRILAFTEHRLYEGTHAEGNLHEQDGGDFIAETGRSLAGPGREQSFSPFSRFQLARWSKDADGQLDSRRVQYVRVGWGAYLGTEGEQVQFTLALPQVGSVVSKAPPKRGNAAR